MPNAVDGPVDCLSRREAQALAVIAQGLAYPPPRRIVRLDDLSRLVTKLGCVQLDTISVISRSHETVAFSRLGPYDRNLWEQLYEPHHAITEYWAHAAAIIPMENLHLFRPHMERVRDRLAEVDSDQEPVRTAVLHRIRTEGPLASRHFDAPEDSSTTAWDWYGSKPEREALADLRSEGRLILRRRENFQRIFDVPEDLSPDLWTREIDEDEHLLALARQALAALGVTTVSWFADYFRTGGRPYLPRPVAKSMLDRMVKNGGAMPVMVEGVDDRSWMSSDLIPVLEQLRSRRGWPTRTVLLSPFDNLIWYRPRGEQVWGFRYRLECYTPAIKRVYGYYSLPILHRGRLVGRLDPSFDRKQKVLTIKSFHWEPGVRPGDAMKQAVMKAIGDLCIFLGTESDRWNFAGEPTGRLPQALAAGTRPTST